MQNWYTRYRVKHLLSDTAILCNELKVLYQNLYLFARDYTKNYLMSYKGIKVLVGTLQINLHRPTSASAAMFLCPEWQCCTRVHTLRAAEWCYWYKKVISNKESHMNSKMACSSMHSVLLMFYWKGFFCSSLYERMEFVGGVCESCNAKIHNYPKLKQCSVLTSHINGST